MLRILVLAIQIGANIWLYRTRKDGWSMSKLALFVTCVLAVMVGTPPSKPSTKLVDEVKVTDQPIDPSTIIKEQGPASSSSVEEAYQKEIEQYKSEVSRLQQLLAEKELTISELETQLNRSNSLVTTQQPSQPLATTPLAANCANGNCSYSYSNSRAYTNNRRGLFGGFFRRR